MSKFEHRSQSLGGVARVAKILIVEGNTQIRLLTVKLLQTRADWQVSEATDGYEAIDQVSQLKPDLVILDFAMAGLNGFETATRIATQFPNLPIVLYTFYGFDGMKAEAKKHGISEVVDKTASSEHLFEAIEKYLGDEPTSSEVPSERVITINGEAEPRRPE
jgi:CheY-like chemotaxis protein